LVRNNTIESVEDDHIEHFKITTSRPSVLIHKEIDSLNPIPLASIEADKAEQRRKSFKLPHGYDLLIAPNLEKPVPRLIVQLNSSELRLPSVQDLSRNRVPIEDED
jgi:hypothetical protein